jgi:hypothetical protein
MDGIEVLQARAAIADLVHAYALFIRKGRPADVEPLFTEDAAFEVRYADPLAPESAVSASRSEGRAAVVAQLVRSATATRMFPMIHNLLIEVDGDAAQASCLMVGRSWPEGVETMGEYADRFRREADGWRFVERVFTICRPA